MAGLETADTSTDGVIGLNTEGEVSNKSAISDVHSDIVYDEQDDELVPLFF